MDSTILAGILGALATIMAAVFSPYFANKVQERKNSKYMPIAPITRQNALFGTWVGELDQKTGIDRVLNKHSLKLFFMEGSHPIVGINEIRI